MASQDGGQTGGRRPAPPISGWAWASIALALVGLFGVVIAGDPEPLLLGLLTFGLVSALAALLAVVALGEIKRSQGDVTGTAIVICALVASGIALADAVVTVLAPSGLHRVPSTRCAANLRNISVAFQEYRMDNPAGEGPEGLEQVYPYAPSEKLFVCPSDGSPPVIGGGLRCSYRYVGRLSASTDGPVIVVYEKRGNHPEQRNVVQYDGVVRQLTQEEFKGAIAGSMALVRQHWDDYTAERRRAIEDFYHDTPWP